MQRVARLLLDMVSAGVITDYAVFDAVAQMRYTEAVSTMDANILIGLSERPGLDILKPIYDYCASKGYSPEGEAVRVFRRRLAGAAGRVVRLLWYLWVPL
jgi:hypothetical protein